MLYELRTERLCLRGWRQSDREPFATLNSDPRVMKHFPGMLTREESDALADRFEAHFIEYGFGLWAVEITPIAPFAGFVGLAIPRFKAHFTPCVEIGWRLATEYWNQGYASEAARAVLSFGFETLQLKEIVSFTVPENLPSRRVMEKIGMKRNKADDFDHPLLSAGNPFRQHVLYRMGRTSQLNESAAVDDTTGQI